MLVRIWLAFSVVIAIVLGVLAGLSILRHNATFADLLGRRMSVIAQTTAGAFQPIVDLGLPMSMVRGGDGILARAGDIDPDIRAAHAFNPSGIITYSTEDPSPQTVPPEVLKAMQLAEGREWSIETPTEIYSGFNVQRVDQTVGSVVVAYPVDRLAAASRAITTRTVWVALTVWAVLSVVAYLALGWWLATPLRALARLGDDGACPVVTERSGRRSLLAPAVTRLRQNLAEAARQFEAAERALAEAGGGDAADGPAHADAAPAETIAGDPSRSLAARLASRLAPVAALFIVAAAMALGADTFRQVSRSFEPEFAARTDLIGTVVSENVQRAISGGVPIDRLVGAEQYFGDMLQRLPEVAHIAVVAPDGRRLLEAGDPPRAGGNPADAGSHPILHEGQAVGAVIIDVDHRFVARSFRDVFLDTGVVILVSVLLSFEIMVLLLSRSLTGPLDRLQRLAAMQAVGDFSMRVLGGATGAVGRLINSLSRRAETLHARFLVAWQRAEARGTALTDIGRRFRLSPAGPATLRLTYFTNIRLALFLFAAADELPASFLVLYTRAAANPWPWIEASVLLSLPVAGGLLAGLLAAPLARNLTERLGSRRLLMLASLPVIGANIGMFWADSVPEIVLWRTVTGFGYALVVLACEDYVIDTASSEDRDRALGMFSTVYFGGIFAGTALGGVLAERFGQSTVFLVSAALVAASLALIVWLTSASAARAAEAPVASITWRGVLANRRFAALLVGVVTPAQVIDYAYVLFLVPLLLDSLGVAVADIARCLMLYCLAVAAVGNLPARLVAIGLTPAAGAVVGLALAGAALLSVAAAPTPLTMIAVLIVAGVGFGLVRWAAVSVALGLAETDLAHLGAASVLGTLRPFERIVSLGGLFVIAALAGRIGYAGATAAVALWALAGAALFLPFALAGRSRGVAE